MLFLLLQPLFKKSKQRERHQGICKKKMALQENIYGKIKRIYRKIIGIDKVIGYKYCYTTHQFYFCKEVKKNYKIQLKKVIRFTIEAKGISWNNANKSLPRPS